MLGIVAAVAILCGALMGPLLLLWGGYCLTRPDRRGEGLSILGFGTLAVLCLLVIGTLTAPADSPGIFRLQALVILSGVFTLGAIVGKALYHARSWFQTTA